MDKVPELTLGNIVQLLKNKTKQKTSFLTNISSGVQHRVQSFTDTYLRIEEKE